MKNLHFQRTLRDLKKTKLRGNTRELKTNKAYLFIFDKKFHVAYIVEDVTCRRVKSVNCVKWVNGKRESNRKFKFPGDSSAIGAFVYVVSREERRR